ncbi:tetraacyldisaccharide 4'-kinase [Limibaculum sp. M0105]|uniref:Tetraacyldisaccharide 4'-kinase n=1 Tax=Thermohalobaculum xanthum TaxID=2753746 RepID=A0A8J7SCH4_9RHOB|nr:tetraacyldisaccharide 4'-kinase [Thermohalobaculum xanthum]MBK0397887.1 tetraacyldisaccharide 4'-kinase [Thermohalobaculum xanthum]
MRAPEFWWASPRRPGWQARLLAPLAALWRVGAAIRASGDSEDPGVPVVCVGNLTAGGAGKTPTVVALTRRLQAQGVEPHVLLRGHGGSVSGPHRVDPDRDGAAEVGDEALIHAAIAPTWVSRDRLAGARAAARAGARVVLMDDGFQNPHVLKALSILVVDAEQGFGNGRLIPAGPLREPVETGLRRADLVLLIGAEEARAQVISEWPQLRDRKIVGARLVPVATGLPLEGEPVVAFAGIGRPGKFFDTLRQLGARIVAAEGFPDHHVYDARVLSRMLRLARGSGAMLVTTEKDAARLPAAFRREVMVVQVALEPDAWDVIDTALDHLTGH